MTERRRPTRRGRSQRSDDATSTEALADSNPYLDLDAPAAPVVERQHSEQPQSERPHNEAAPTVSLVPNEPAVRDVSANGSADSTGGGSPNISSDVSSGSYSNGAGSNGAGSAGDAFQDEGRGGMGGAGGGQQRGRHRRFRQRKGGAAQGGQGQQGQGQQSRPQQQNQQQNSQQGHSNAQQGLGGRRNNRRNRPPEQQQQQAARGPVGPVGPIVVDGEATGLFDPQRDAGFLRNAANSYLADPKDPLIPLQLVRQVDLRRGDLITASVGHDQRGRVVAAELTSVNGADPEAVLRRPEFQSLTASYPDRKLTLETGKPAKGGPELTRRAIDLIAPIGYGQRALIVAPGRAGKKMPPQAVI
ncbi:MAG: hypothetical protein ACR2M1_10335 [Gemmatimonadaceae bacterium]